MEDKPTLESQFHSFVKYFDNNSSGKTITLYTSDYWMRQAGILDDRKLTMTDTGLLFFKYSKSVLTFGEWCEMLSELCTQKNLDKEDFKTRLTNCGLPGEVIVDSRQFRSYFKNSISTSNLTNIGIE